MKVLKTLLAFSLLSFAGTAFAQSSPQPAGKAAACCAKSAEGGKACEHSCCVDAAKAGKNCEKCGGKNEKKS